MYYKLYYEDGNYLKKETGEAVHILCAEEVYLPEGEPMWDYFETYEEMLESYGVEERNI